MSRYALLATLSLGALVAPSWGQEQPAELPAAEQLFAKHVQAVGGEEAMKAEKNRVARGKIAVMGRSGDGILTTLRIAPNRLYNQVEFPGVATIETWCDGESAWIRDSNGGTRRLTGEPLIEVRRSADFLGEANFRNRYSSLKTQAKTTFADRPAFSVKATTTEGNERTLFFDTERGFLIGYKMPGPTGDPTNERTTIFSDYKPFGGVSHPTKTIQKDSRSETTITFTEIEANVVTMQNIDPPDEVRKAK
ncbi:MAG: hypothetical protein ACKVW3_11975 [Phycisphaerales bacterium]